MSDPISGMGGGAAKIALQQLQQMQNVQPQQAQQPAGQGVSGFQQKLQAQNVQQPQEIQQLDSTQKAGKTKSIRDIAQAPKVDQVQKTDATRLNKVDKADKGEMKGVGRFLQGLQDKKADIDNIMAQAIKGKNFSQKELLVIQFKVSTYSMEMDLTSKVVDKSVSGLKQAMNTQV